MPTRAPLSSCWRAVAGLLLALAALPLPAAIADWPMYGHDVANTRDAGDDGPTRGEVAGFRRLWRFRVADGPVTGTPAVRGHRLVAAARGGTVFALDTNTGRPLWKRDAGGQVHASLAIDGGRVLVPVSRIGRPYVLALDLKTGKPRWKSLLDTQSGSDLYSSPVPWRGRVFVGVSALHAEYYSADPRARGSVVALDARTGQRRWKTFTVPASRDGGSVWSTPAIDDRAGRLFVGTGNAYHAPSDPATDAIVVFDAWTGALRGSYQASPQDWWNAHDRNDSKAGTDADFGASPNLFVDGSGRELVGEAQKSGLYWALDRQTLEMRWASQVAPPSGIGGVIGSTAYDGRRIYGPETVDAHVWALGTDGKIAWTRDDPGDLRYCAVAVARGVLYGADGAGRLVARRTSDGKRLGRWSLGGKSWGGVSIARGRIFAVTGTSDDHVGAVAAFGRPAHRHR